MTCEKCGNKNPGGASYCTQCGAPLGWICDCSFINKQEHKFCGGCGILSSEKTVNKSNSSKNIDSICHQYSSTQISDLIQESIFFKAGSEEKLDQSDIDNIFLNDKEING